MGIKDELETSHRIRILEKENQEILENERFGMREKISPKMYI